MLSIIEKSDQTTNYEISKTVKNHISESGVIKKMSIGILVDGIYKINQATGESEYIPRTKEDLDKISNLVKVAIGFDEDRSDKIEVINMKFSSELDTLGEDESDWIKEELPKLFQTLIFAIVVLLVLITVIRPIALKAFEVRKVEEYGSEDGLEGIEGAPKGVPSTLDSSGSAAQKSSAVASLGEEDNEPTIPKINPVTKINEIANSNPQDLVNILRKWLNEDG